ncbi:MAG: aminoacyl-tRNA hydrolase [Anaerolineales bacterium]|jgi:PTH1 family peptidyl-tRNA hydrolase
MSLDAAVVGLGNPGRQYLRNRHNIGYRVAERVAQQLQARFSRKGFHCLLASASAEGKAVLLAKPQTFMNASGQAVEALVRFHAIPYERLLVCCDDIDLPFGTLRLRPMGGSGGQKGMQSIISALGTEEFPRLRIGIGHPPEDMDPAAYVLQDFAPQEEEKLGEIVGRAAEAVDVFIRSGLQAAMNRYNGDPDTAGSPRVD